MKKELTEKEKSYNFEFIKEFARLLSIAKGFEYAYSNPNLGKMVVNLNGKNFIVEVTPLVPNEGKKDSTLDEAYEQFKYIFN